MGAIVSFRDLEAWQAGMDLVITTYELCRRFPKDEQFDLVRQMRRAAVSIPSNIAEGHGNGLSRRYRHHVAIALGSLGELSTQLEIAVRLKYVTEETTQTIGLQLARTRQLLHGLRRSLNRQLVARGLALTLILLATARALS